MNRIYFLLLNSIVASLISTGILYAQETKKIAPLGTNEEYFVLKSNKKVKNGEYKRFHPFKSKVVVVKGQYKNNERVGVWEYFDGMGNPNQRFDYTNNKILSHQAYSIFNLSRVLTGESIEKLSSPPVYLNGEMILVEWLAKNVKYPAEATRTKTSGTVWVYFTIDKFGKPINHYVKESPGFGLNNEALRAVKSIPSDFWFPGIIEGEPVDVEITMPVNFNLN